METKKLIEYDMKSIFSKVAKEYGKIEKGMEDLYNPQLDYIEQEIYEIYSENYISDYELQSVISIVIYDLKSYVDNKVYDYTDICETKLIDFAKELEMLFNPFINKEIKVNEVGKKDLKGLFTLPIICLARIYLSIDFWRKNKGKDGYFRMLEDMVVPIKKIGKYPYALSEEYLD